MMHRKEDYKLGLGRKELLLTHEKCKSPEDGSGPGAVSLEGGQGLKQTGGSSTEPSLDQNLPNSSRTGWETGSGTGSRIGSGTVPEPVSPSIPATLTLLGMLMLTMQAFWLIEKAPQVWLNFLDPVWYLGQPRNNTLLPCPQQKLNMLQLLRAVLKCCG